MSSSLLFVSGQIAVLEDKLLKPGQLDRMIGADTPDEAFGVMSELSYAQYFDDTLKAKYFPQVIERGLIETKDLLVSGTDNHPVLGIVWWRFDVNNIKRAVKEKVLDGATSITDFTEDNGYSPLGQLDQASVEALVFQKQEIKDFPKGIQEVVLNADFEDIYALELALDHSYMTTVSKVSRDSSVKSYTQLLVDAYNLRSLTRSVLILETSLDAQLWAEGGNIELYTVANVDTLEALKEALKGTFIEMPLKALPDSIPGEELLIRIEQIIDRYVYDWLKNISLGNDSILRVLYYFEQRLQNARMLKTVMLGKFYGLGVEAIQEKLKHVGH